jgi:GLPGLI family protein
MKLITNIKAIALIIAICSSSILQAQQFVEKAVIEYEVKTNVKKTMGNSRWAEMLAEAMPQFKTAYYNFTFADNKSVYKFDHWDAGPKMPEFMRKNDEENVWYFDYAANKYNMQKNVFGSVFNVEDSIPQISWRLTNENRIIAGFNCRKAVARIMDSVYVFAFYTDEIVVPGGPCSINGLPGMILGLTIPRMYTSYIATKITLNNVNVADIKPVSAKKNYTYSALKTNINSRIKEWVSEDDDEESRMWMNQFLWGVFL